MKNNRKQKALAMLLGLSSMTQLPGNASAHKEKQQQVIESSVSDKGLTNNNLGLVNNLLSSNSELLACLKLLGLAAIPTLAGTALYKSKRASNVPSLVHDADKDAKSANRFMRKDEMKRKQEKIQKKIEKNRDFVMSRAVLTERIDDIDKRLKGIEGQSEINKLTKKIVEEKRKIFNNQFQISEAVGEVFESSLPDGPKIGCNCLKLFFKDVNNNWYCLNLKFDENVELPFSEEKAKSIIVSALTGKNSHNVRLENIGSESIADVKNINIKNKYHLNWGGKDLFLSVTSTCCHPVKKPIPYTIGENLKAFVVFPSNIELDEDSYCLHFRCLFFSDDKDTSIDDTFLSVVNEDSIGSQIPLYVVKDASGGDYFDYRIMIENPEEQLDEISEEGVGDNTEGELPDIAEKVREFKSGNGKSSLLNLENIDPNKMAQLLQGSDTENNQGKEFIVSVPPTLTFSISRRSEKHDTEGKHKLHISENVRGCFSDGGIHQDRQEGRPNIANNSSLLKDEKNEEIGQKTSFAISNDDFNDNNNENNENDEDLINKVRFSEISSHENHKSSDMINAEKNSLVNQEELANGTLEEINEFIGEVNNGIDFVQYYKIKDVEKDDRDNIKRLYDELETGRDISLNKLQNLLGSNTDKVLKRLNERWEDFCKEVESYLGGGI